jgi:hypothetical protein
MKYRAIARGVLHEGKPLQSYGSNVAVVRDWAKEIAQSHGSSVDIFVTEERLIETVDKLGQSQSTIEGGL